MKKHILLTAAAILGAGSIFAADVEVKADANATSPRVDVDARREFKQEPRPENAIRPVNRAHSLLGMEVKNRDGEKLGEIKDIVVDLQSGRISYVALSAGGFLGIREKLIAVPANSVTPSESGSFLILDATRGEIQDAPGFAATNWPDHRMASHDPVFFHPKNRGSAATTERGSARLYTDANPKDREVRVEANPVREREIVGRVKAIDNASVIVDANGRSETFSLNDNRSIRPTDYRVGDRIIVKYHTDNGKMIIDNLARQ